MTNSAWYTAISESAPPNYVKTTVYQLLTKNALTTLIMGSFSNLETDYNLALLGSLAGLQKGAVFYTLGDLVTYLISKLGQGHHG